MHNGYAEHVAHLYEGMDLTKTSNRVKYIFNPLSILLSYIF